MSDSDQYQLISDLARDVIVQVVPEEAPLFRANSEAYFKDPEKSLKSQSGKDEALGFGIGETILMLTPTALSVMNTVITFLTEEAKKSLQTESSSLIAESVKQMFKKFRTSSKTEDIPAKVTLTADQLQEVHKIALAKARQLKLSEARAKLLADAVVGQLALSK